MQILLHEFLIHVISLEAVGGLSYRAVRGANSFLFDLNITENGGKT